MKKDSEQPTSPGDKLLLSAAKSSSLQRGRAANSLFSGGPQGQADTVKRGGGTESPGVRREGT